MTAAFAISEIGGTECHLGRTERAARLVGAADEALRVLGAARHSGDLPEHERVLHRLATELGERRLSELRRDGARVSIVDAIAYALGERDPFEAPGSAGA